MNNKNDKKNIMKIFIILTSLFLLITFILVKNNLDIDISDFIFEGICLILIVIGFIISLELKVKTLSVGCAIFAISMFNDSLDELKFIPFSKWQNLIFEKFLFGLGIIFIVYGFYKIINQKNTLLKELNHLALSDPLTNLLNIRSLENKLKLDIEQASKNNTKIGVLFIDLDKFKLINDSLGHNAGNYILKKVAKRLRLVTRQEDTIARLGGDEFILILNDINETNEIIDIVRNIINVFKTPPFILKEKEFTVTCSMGISIFPDDGKDIETLFKNADIAMYKAKENQGNTYEFYNYKMSEQMDKNIEIEHKLKHALEKREFILHYQPKVDIKTNKITGLEALVRWKCPEKGLIYPNNFIPVAEETGLIKKLDEHILELSCLQIKEWINEGLNPPNISINISGKTFYENDFLDRLESILEDTEVSYESISIEITETAAMKDKKYTYKILEQIRSKGIKILLDDFGKGYSSLSYLKDFPIDVLKIDKSFVDNICYNNIDSSITRAIIDMAKALKLKVLAEGVETEEQLRLLDNFSCEEYQGYLFSKPLPVEKIEIMLTKNTEKTEAI
ncbi:bifunctional diguanylate cyclase/phosphodiesterase [Tepidibacter hydrothermalis]|uniref:Bifunctional diguanylate cyclase/phosphodiesterase n=1 Tax=Tepidibacter hydrothermalis TaxID=3036126 RepID=A0ABY8EA87_9FIRM|nr:bifunctional diguanylate cyclase/phosphodiesterase [Tepidibacter hydrothermalis]WFD09832.1 bifunctional diguanylate cyclase/phosphodiesterase [Tepidibacter hydrothermalis]